MKRKASKPKFRVGQRVIYLGFRGVWKIKAVIFDQMWRGNYCYVMSNGNKCAYTMLRPLTKRKPGEGSGT